MSRRLDWSDETEVRIWLAGLREGIDEMDGVASDMLKPPRQRDLGPVLAAKNYTAAREAVLHALNFAETDDGEPSDPAGCGGSPAH